MSECETNTGQRGRHSWLTQWGPWVCNLDAMTKVNTSPCPLFHLARLLCIATILHNRDGPPQRCLWLLSPQGLAIAASSHTCGVVLIFRPMLLFSTCSVDLVLAAKSCSKLQNWWLTKILYKNLKDCHPAFSLPTCLENEGQASQDENQSTWDWAWRSPDTPSSLFSHTFLLHLYKFHTGNLSQVSPISDCVKPLFSGFLWYLL